MEKLTSSRNPECAIDRVHAESRAWETGYVGACRFLIEDAMYDLHDGDFLLIPPQVLHYTRYLFGTCRRSAVFFRRDSKSITALRPVPIERRTDEFPFAVLKKLEQ